MREWMKSWAVAVALVAGSVLGGASAFALSDAGACGCGESCPMGGECGPRCSCH